MSKRRKSPKGVILTDKDRMKMEIAEELGLREKVLAGGWRCLSAKESGKIGGIMSRRRNMPAEEGRAERWIK